MMNLIAALALSGFAAAERPGDFWILNGIEYQIPVSANDTLYPVGFVDSGTVESGAPVRDYRVQAGAGLRLQVPVLGPVPIAVDFFPVLINPAPNDNKQLFSFWIGLFN
jgi:outer membrane translocation and assembly module TamA